MERRWNVAWRRSSLRGMTKVRHVAGRLTLQWDRGRRREKLHARADAGRTRASRGGCSRFTRSWLAEASVARIAAQRGLAVAGRIRGARRRQRPHGV